MMRAVGMAGKIWQANSPQNKPLQAKTKPAEQGSAGNTAGGLSARLRPQNTRTTVGQIRSNQTAAVDVGLSPCR